MWTSSATKAARTALGRDPAAGGGPAGGSPSAAPPSPRDPPDSEQADAIVHSADDEQGGVGGEADQALLGGDGDRLGVGDGDREPSWCSTCSR